MTKFYDTSSLLLEGNLFAENERFSISSITLEELENIKTSSNKDADVKFNARKLLRELDAHMGEYDVILYKDSFFEELEAFGFSMTNDMKILVSAFQIDDEVIFITNDLCLKHIAKQFFRHVESIEEKDDGYDGYREVQMTVDEMAYFYENMDQNIYDLLTNEYLVVRDDCGSVVDRLCWNGTEHRHLTYSTFSSTHFGDVKPLKDDVYQAFVADSFVNNKITLVRGPAGSGKTLLSLAYLLNRLEKGKIDKIIIFCNTVATKDSAKLGYYPGTRDEKLLDSQIGNLLTSKFGDRCEVERMIGEGKLLLLPCSDIRGFDTSGMRAGVYISEAQNMSVSLMKLALQRIGDDGICIIDGDCKTQVDDINFAGSNNGMRRVSKVFRGEDIYGEVTLKNIHRSRIGQIAENM